MAVSYGGVKSPKINFVEKLWFICFLFLQEYANCYHVKCYVNCYITDRISKLECFITENSIRIEQYLSWHRIQFM